MIIYSEKHEMSGLQMSRHEKTFILNLTRGGGNNINPYFPNYYKIIFIIF